MALLGIRTPALMSRWELVHVCQVIYTYNKWPFFVPHFRRNAHPKSSAQYVQN